MMMVRVQDCVCVVAPYPFRIEPLEDFNPTRIGDLGVTGGGDVCQWYARPLLTVYPTGHMGNHDTTLHTDFDVTFDVVRVTPVYDIHMRYRTMFNY
jgi:hypothetical protein